VGCVFPATGWEPEGTVVTYSSPESIQVRLLLVTLSFPQFMIVQDLRQMVVSLKDRVSALEKVMVQTDIESQVLRAWQTANLVLHGAFVPFFH
jgi:hypothetical protein